MTPDDDERLRRTELWQDPSGRAKELGEVWTLAKRGRTACCLLQGHPLGTEARVLVDDELISSKVFRDPKALVDETAAWREAYEEKGWHGLESPL